VDAGASRGLRSESHPSLHEMKTCCRCRTISTDENSDRVKSGKRVGEFKGYCRSCGLAHKKECYRRNPEHYRARQRQAVARNPEKYRLAQRLRRLKDPEKHRQNQYRLTLQRNYGLSWEDYDRMLQRQAGRCAICRKPFSEHPHVDHDHATGTVRGLLCRKCNVSVGGFDDSPERLRAAASYLESSLDKPASEGVS
jgi:hypothetical protein